MQKHRCNSLIKKIKETMPCQTSECQIIQSQITVLKPDSLFHFVFVPLAASALKHKITSNAAKDLHCLQKLSNVHNFSRQSFIQTFNYCLRTLSEHLRHLPLSSKLKQIFNFYHTVPALWSFCCESVLFSGMGCHRVILDKEE